MTLSLPLSLSTLSLDSLSPPIDATLAMAFPYSTDSLLGAGGSRLYSIWIIRF